MTLSHHHDHDRLSDYEIAINFGDTLSLIYKEKMEELNNDLKEVYSHLDKLAIPQVPEFHRWFARATVPHWAEERFLAIEHIQKIRNLYRKIKKEPTVDKMDIEKAKAVPISTLYDWIIKKNMVSCPFHTDKTPSMKLNKNNTVKCFSCGFFGDGISLIMRLDQKTFKEAVEYLNKL